MGRKDVVACRYLQNDDVIVDIFNGFAFGGQQKLSPSQLCAMDSASKDIQKGKSLVAYRDVIRGVSMKGGGIAMLLGIEAQTVVDCTMPVRIMGYNYLSYRNAIESVIAKKAASGKRAWQGFAHGDRIPPVCSLVVFFSPEPWDGGMTLRDMSLPVPEDFQELVPDYGIKVMAPYSMTDEEINLFQTDFRELMLLIKYAKNAEKIREITASSRFRKMRAQAIEVFNAVSNSRFKIRIKQNGGQLEMGYALDDIHADGVKEGIAIGEKRGITIGEKRGITIGQKRGITIGKAEFAGRFITTCRGEGMQKETIVKQLRSVFGMSAKEANTYIQMTAGD